MGQVSRRTSRDPWYVRWLLTGAALALLTLLVIVPVLAVFFQAIEAGLQTYWNNLVNDADTRHSILLTLAVVPTAVLLNLIFGVAAAWAIARFRFPGRTALLTVIDMPFAISPVVAGLLLVLIFGQQGYLGPWLREHGISVLFSPPGLVIATTFVTLPFVARELIPVMESIGPDEELAAVSLGAGAVADVLESDDSKHSLGPALWRDFVQRPGHGRIRGGIGDLGPYRRADRYDAAARGKGVSGI